MKIAVGTGSSLVKSIEIAVKIGDLGIWESYQILDKEDEGIADDAEYVYIFNNNRIPTPLDQTSVLTANNFNPELADTQEFLPTNELCYGGVTEGKDNIEIDIELSPEVTLRPYTTKAGYLYHTDVYALAHYIIIDVPEDTPTLDAQSEYTIRVQFSDGNVHTLKFSRNLISSTLKNKIIDVIEDVFPVRGSTRFAPDGPGIYQFDPVDGKLWLIAPEGETNSLQITPTFPTLTPGEKLYFPSWINMAESKDDIVNEHGSPLSASLFPDVVQRVVDSITITHRDNSSDPILDPEPSFGDGEYQVGLVYEDGAGRISSVQSSEDSSVKVSELSIGFGIPDAPASAVIDLELSVKNRPPEWAKYWRPVITKNTTQTVVATWVPDYFYAQRIRGRGQLIFSISSTLIESKSLAGATYEPYQYQQGDYLRVVGKIQPDGEVFADGRSFSLVNDEFLVNKQRTIRDYNQTSEAFVSEKVDVVDSDENPIYSSVFQNIIIDYDDRYDTRIDGTLPFDINRNTVIQIVRPKKELSVDLFFGAGQVFEVGNPGEANRYHKGLSQDQSATNPATTPAIVELDSGGRYSRTRFDAAKGVDFPVLETDLSDIYSSKLYSIGKPFVEDDDSERRKNNLLRHSGKYFDNTNINDLSNFQFDDYVSIDDRFGIITRIIQVGDALKVYQPLKTTSVYIGKSFIKQGDGTDQVMTVDRTFGVVNPSPLDYGCQFPDSVLRNERYVYFFDIYSGSFLRDAPNGLQPISENLMSGYFKAKSKALLESGIENVRVYSGYDDENGLVYVSFVDSTTPANSETLAYHENSNRWISFLSFIPDMYASFGSSVFSAKSNQLYIHNSDNVSRCEFYGVKYPRQFKVYGNIQPSIVKVFLSMSIFTDNDGWSVPEIKIDPSVTYPRGMASRLKEGKFKYKEGVAYSEFLRNMLTTSSTPEVLELATGDQLRGESVSLLLEESNNDKAVLYQTDINFIKS